MQVHRHQDNGQACPICKECYVDAFSTLCGHTFCFKCIKLHLEHSVACPCCSQPISSESLFPNLALDKLLHGLPLNYQLATAAEPGDIVVHHLHPSYKGTTRELAEVAIALPLEHLTPLLCKITDQRDRFVKVDRLMSTGVLRDFLSYSGERKTASIDKLEKEINSITTDVKWVENQFTRLEEGSAPSVRGCSATPAFSFPAPTANTGAHKAVVTSNYEEYGNTTMPGRDAASKKAGMVSNTSASTVAEMLSTWGIDQTVPMASSEPAKKGRLAGSPYHFLGSYNLFQENRDAACDRNQVEQKGISHALHENGSSQLDSLRGLDSGRTSIDVSEANDHSFIAASGGRPDNLMQPSIMERNRTTKLKDRRRGTHDRFILPFGAPDCEAAQPSLSINSHALRRTRKILTQFSGLQRMYTQIRCGNLDDYLVRTRRHPSAISRGTRGPVLEQFSRTLSNFTEFDRMCVAGQLRHNSSRTTAPSTAIISSIEFDMDGACFATAGVSKLIQIFDFRDVCGGVEYTGGPVHSMSSPSKISCLSYSKHARNLIASSDYGGLIAVWDIEHNSVVAEYEEHGKRAWTVDYCRTNSKLLASGSDDGRVKIWSVEQDASVLDIDVRANVCCAQYGPNSAHQLAVGCADHKVHIFDLRKPSEALTALSGHRKAVSYVRFLGSGDEIVSASTDSTLCIWNTSELNGGSQRVDKSYHQDEINPRPSRILVGHSNDKNFVGLSVGAGDLIACGSETNEVFLYHKSLSQPLLSHNFSGEQQFLMRGHGAFTDGSGAPACNNSCPSSQSGSRDQMGSNNVAQNSSGGSAVHESSFQEHTQSKFISATCWRGDEHVLLAANSDGVIRVLQLME